VFRDSKTGEFTTEVRKQKGTNVNRSCRPNGAAKNYQAKSKRAEGNR
jgi:hypothetical protein